MAVAMSEGRTTRKAVRRSRSRRRRVVRADGTARVVVVETAVMREDSSECLTWRF
jgi:hypothetical protein